VLSGVTVEKECYDYEVVTPFILIDMRHQYITNGNWASFFESNIVCNDL
jgi:hypothetical protein